MRKKYRRRQYFIDRGFQGRFIWTYVMICLSVMALSIGIFQYLVSMKLETLRWRMIVYENTVSDIIYPYLIGIGAFAIIFTGITLIIFARYLRWKLGGLMHRLQKDLALVRDGNLTLNIRLRRSSRFHDTAEELDIMVKSLRDKYSRINDSFGEARKTMDLLPFVRESLLQEKCEDLKAQVQRLKGALGG